MKYVGINLNRAIQIIKAERGGNYDLEVNTENIRMDDHLKILATYNGLEGEFTLSPWAYSQAFMSQGMPVRYMNKLMQAGAAPLVRDQFNFWINKNDKGEEYNRDMLLRINQSNEIRGFLTSSYSVLNDIDLAQVCRDVHQNIDFGDLEEFRIDGEIMQMRFIIPTGRGNANGTVTYSGIDIINSEVGKSSVFITPMVKISNGSTIRAWRDIDGGDTYRHMHKDEEAFKNLIRKSIDGAVKASQNLALDYLDTKNLVVSEPEYVIEHIIDKAKIFTKKNKESILECFSLEPENTWFGVINAFSKHALSLADDDRLEMEAFAGHLVSKYNKRYDQTKPNIALAS